MVNILISSFQKAIMAILVTKLSFVTRIAIGGVCLTSHPGYYKTEPEGFQKPSGSASPTVGDGRLGLICFGQTGRLLNPDQEMMRANIVGRFEQDAVDLFDFIVIIFNAEIADRRFMTKFSLISLGCPVDLIGKLAIRVLIIPQ
jgi:hypothetical protein